MQQGFIWVLSFTILGPIPQHKTFDKYETKEACQQALQAAREQLKSEGKNIVGTCSLMLKSPQNKK